MAMPMSRALANGSSSGNFEIIGWARLTHSTADGTLLTKCKAETVCVSRQGGFCDRQSHNRPGLAHTRACTRGRAHVLSAEQHLIHMERKQPRDMMPSSTFSGLLPKGVSSTLAIMLLSLCFSKTEPMEKPAMNSSTCTARSS